MKNSIRTSINRHIVLFSLMITILLGYFTYTTVLHLTFEIAESIAHESSSVISTEINSIINREIYIALNLSKSEKVILWMKNESSEKAKEELIDELKKYLEDLRDENIFLALEASKNFYFVETPMSSELDASYVIDESLDTDRWYFNTRDFIDDYDLNVDFDRKLQTIRIWININVYDQGEFLGIIGTGIELNPILEGIFSEEDNYNSESLIFDSFGAIQLINDIDRIQENSFGEADFSKSIYSYSDSQAFRNEILSFIEKPTRNKVIEIDKNRRFMILSPIENTDWFMATYYDTEEIFSFIDFLPLEAIIFTLFLIFIIGINSIVKVKVISPIEKLNESLLNEDSYGLDRKDEIGNLSNTIVEMNKKLVLYSHELEDKYKLQKELLNNFLDKVPVGVVKLDQATRILSANEHFKNMINGDNSEYLKDLLCKSEDMIKAVKEKGQIVLECGHEHNKKWLEFQALSFNADDDLLDLLITDVTEKKLHEMELVQIASKDPLTGLYNRRKFESLVQDEVYKLNRYGVDLSLILFDIDHFKKVNDHYGHAVGDQVLQTISKEILSDIRSSDYFARWGGEEFVILLTNTNLDQAKIKAEELRQVIESIDFHLEHNITASFGVAGFTRSETYEDVFKRVDAYLYHAKESGRNKIAWE